MPFLELALTVHAAQQESAEAALADLGALAVAGEFNEAMKRLHTSEPGPGTRDPGAGSR